MKSMGGKKAASNTKPAVYPGWGGGRQPRQCQRIWGILVTLAAGRTGRPRLAVTQIDSGLARELDCVESWAVARNGSSTQRGSFQKGN